MPAWQYPWGAGAQVGAEDPPFLSPARYPKQHQGLVLPSAFNFALCFARGCY